jgi:hypothetical protein
MTGTSGRDCRIGEAGESAGRVELGPFGAVDVVARRATLFAEGAGGSRRRGGLDLFTVFDVVAGRAALYAPRGVGAAANVAGTRPGLDPFFDVVFESGSDSKGPSHSGSETGVAEVESPSSSSSLFDAARALARVAGNAETRCVSTAVDFFGSSAALEADGFLNGELKQDIKRISALGAVIGISVGVIYGIKNIKDSSSRGYASPLLPTSPADKLTTSNRVTNSGCDKHSDPMIFLSILQVVTPSAVVLLVQPHLYTVTQLTPEKKWCEWSHMISLI